MMPTFIWLLISIIFIDVNDNVGRALIFKYPTLSKVNEYYQCVHKKMSVITSNYLPLVFH